MTGLLHRGSSAALRRGRAYQADLKSRPRAVADAAVDVRGKVGNAESQARGGAR